MKTKQYSYLILLTALSLWLSGCSKFLDVRPRNEVPREEMFQKESGFRDALTACYIKMTNETLYGRYLTMEATEHLANLWLRPNPQHQEQYLLQSHNYNTTIILEQTKAIYGDMYNIIVNANVLLTELKNRGDLIENPVQKKVIEGEAYGIRAMLHMDILRLYGQVPNNPTITRQLYYCYVDDLKAPLQMCSYDEFVSNVEKDFLAAEALLADSDPAREYSFDQLNGLAPESESIEVDILDDFLRFRQQRLNLYAVQALMARFYQYIGNTAKASEYAHKVIDATVNGKPVVKLSTKDDAAKAYHGSPSEALFLLNDSRLVTRSVPIVGGAPGYSLSAGSQSYLTEDMLTSGIFNNTNLESDARYTYLWERTTNINNVRYPTTKKYYYRELPGGGITDAERREYSFSINKQQVIPIIRLSELYLILMENSRDLAELNSLYNTYMRSKGVILAKDQFASLSDFKQQLVNEYIREFIAEGQVFYLYKRLGTKKMKFQTDSMTEEQYLFPIPESDRIDEESK